MYAIRSYYEITENYPFKRYRGGLTSDILLYDFKSKSTERVTTNEANDGKPAWVGDKVFFLSDRGENMRLNVWAYNPVITSYSIHYTKLYEYFYK